MEFMGTPTAVLLLLTVSLAAALSGGVWWHRRCRAKWGEQLRSGAEFTAQQEFRLSAQRDYELAQAQSHHEQLQASVQGQHSATISSLRSEHGQTLDRTRAAHANEVAALRDQCERHELSYKTIVGLYTKSIGIGERNSRRQIVDVCRESRLDAVLLSNIVFQTHAGGDEFHAQIDHLLITESAMLIIENKYWNGLVFDGIDASARYPILAPLLSGVDGLAEGTRAVQLVRDDPLAIGKPSNKKKETGITLRVIPSPAEQTRTQAYRFSEFLKMHDVHVPWINTCVYYSRQKATVVHAAQHRSTTLVSNGVELAHCIQQLEPTKESIDLGKFVQVLAPLGPDVTGIGSFAARWKSPLDDPLFTPEDGA